VRPSVECAAPANITNGFAFAFTATLRKPEHPVRLVDLPGVAQVTLSLRDKTDGDMRLNYCNFKLSDGSIPVMEATVSLSSPEHPDWKQMTVGFPLACLKEPYGTHAFVLNFTGVRWMLYADGELMDLDFPFGYPDWKTPRVLMIDPAAVQSVRLYAPALQAEASSQKPSEQKEAQYWTPHGFNTWVGDVATGFYKGRYHLFYLLDRRHHSSKFGKGAHYFEHLSTADFKTWTEHEAAVLIENQWECIGTGTPFVFEGKLCLAYGLHTERICPLDQTTQPAQEAYLKAHGCTGAFSRDASGTPVGSTYSVSEDGATFKKTWTFFHMCRNPSVYIDPDGKLRMLANSYGRGMWESTGSTAAGAASVPISAGRRLHFLFPVGQIRPYHRRFPQPVVEARRRARFRVRRRCQKGLDFYDGLNVPCVTEVGGGRFILAGWTCDYGWAAIWRCANCSNSQTAASAAAGCRRWSPRPVRRKRWTRRPKPHGDGCLPPRLQVKPAKNFCWQTGGRLGKWDGACRFEIDLASNRAQFAQVKSDGATDRQKSLREGCGINGTRQFAIENLIATDKPFPVRLIVKFDPKAGGSLIDAEIAGSRTMISFWPRLSVSDVSFDAQDVGVNDITLAPLK
jgi:hypothetical protein